MSSSATAATVSTGGRSRRDADRPGAADSREPIGCVTRHTVVRPHSLSVPAASIRAVLGLALLALLTACGDQVADSPRPSGEVTDSSSVVRLVDPDDADLLLWVSNQSFDDETVTMAIEVDGVTVVDDEFAVEGQHNWIQFPLALPPGEHEITAESDTGATLVERFGVPRDQRRHAVIDHWGEQGSAELTWRVQRRPLAFA